MIDLVLKKNSKLAIRWRGPHRVVNVTSDWVFEVQNLLAPYEISKHYASRLKLHAEGGREVIAELRDHSSTRMVAISSKSFVTAASI